MASAIRENIVGALSTMLATITSANGYRTTIATVEDRARDWAEMRKSDANATDGGWAGIVPQEEGMVDHPGIVQSTWVIDILAHIRTATTTAAAARVAASDFATDVRKLLYDTNGGYLGVAGVHFVRIVRRMDSLGAPEALQERWTTTAIRINVRFEEATDLT